MNESSNQQLREHMDRGFAEIKAILLGDGFSEEGIVNKVRKAQHDANNARTAVVGIDARLTTTERDTKTLIDFHNTRKKAFWLVAAGALASVGSAIWNWVTHGGTH